MKAQRLPQGGLVVAGVVSGLFVTGSLTAVLFGTKVTNWHYTAGPLKGQPVPEEHIRKSQRDTLAISLVTVVVGTVCAYSCYRGIVALEGK